MMSKEEKAVDVPITWRDLLKTMFFFSRCEPFLTCIFKSSLFQVAELVEDASKTVGDLEDVRHVHDPLL